MSMENALALTITAFDKVKPTSRKKRETLALCFEQVKGILKDFMREKGIPLVEVNLETKEALVVEPIPNMIKQAWVQEWLNGELSTEQFEKWLNCKFQNTHYVNFADFLRDVEAWLLEKKGKKESGLSWLRRLLFTVVMRLGFPLNRGIGRFEKMV